MNAPACAKRVLLVDDEARTARMLARMLQEDGYDVEILFDGAAAIGRLTRDPLPDALVTDLRMPHVDGVAVARYARARNPRIPVVVITGYPHMLRARADLGPVVVHTKPVEYATLARQVADAMDGGAGRAGET
jgi:two-component system response regulator MprA